MRQAPGRMSSAKNQQKMVFFEGLFRREATSAPGRLGGRVRLCAGTHASGPGGAPLPPGAGKFRVPMRKTAQPLACEKISPYEILSSPGHRGGQVSNVGTDAAARIGSGVSFRLDIRAASQGPGLPPGPEEHRRQRTRSAELRLFRAGHQGSSTGHQDGQRVGEQLYPSRAGTAPAPPAVSPGDGRRGGYQVATVSSRQGSGTDHQNWEALSVQGRGPAHPAPGAWQRLLRPVPRITGAASGHSRRCAWQHTQATPEGHHSPRGRKVSGTDAQDRAASRV